MWSATTSFAFPEMHDIGTKLVQGMRGVCFDGTSHNNDTSLQPALIFPDSGLCYSTNNVFSGHGCVGSMNSFTVQGWVFLFFFFLLLFFPSSGDKQKRTCFSLCHLFTAPEFLSLLRARPSSYTSLPSPSTMSVSSVRLPPS